MNESRSLQKKREKKSRLIEAAYGQFTERGFFETSVDDIVQSAGIAKGTFYLYFKDKQDLMGEVILLKSQQVLEEALAVARQKYPYDFTERIIALVDEVIEYFKEHIPLLKLIRKNFSWGLVRRQVDDVQSPLGVLIEECLTDLCANGRSREEAFKIMFMAVEMVGSVCYSAIIDGQPASVDQMKPLLYRAVRAVLT